MIRAAAPAIAERMAALRTGFSLSNGARDALICWMLRRGRHASEHVDMSQSDIPLTATATIRIAAVIIAAAEIARCAPAAGGPISPAGDCATGRAASRQSNVAAQNPATV